MNIEDLSDNDIKLMRELKKLCDLDTDCQKVYEYYKKHTPGICYFENKDCNGFSHFVPSLLSSLLGMIKNGTLIYKDAEKAKKISEEEKARRIKLMYEKDCNDLIESIKPHLLEFTPSMCNNFYSYWSEPLTKGIKKGRARYIEQKTWSIERRLATWQKNQDNFKK